MPALLLELHCEEIPARMQRTAMEQLVAGITGGLQEARLEGGEVRSYVTPRRLALTIDAVPDVQPDLTVERKGPKTSAPEKAIEGFCKSVGLSREALEVRSIGKDDVYFAVTEQKGKPAIEALKEVIEPVLQGFHWPKSMRWGEHSRAWVRPLRSIACLLGNQVVPLQWEHLQASNTTFGHRFMAEGAITLATPEDYTASLEQAHVRADADARRALILKQAKALAEKERLTLKEDTGLLDEVTGLVEWPVALMGQFDAAYLRLPPEVLVLEMRHHQKYFALLDAQGTVTNRFITIANIEAPDGGEQIIAGNECVLKARLEDGAFYYEQDRKKPLEDWAEGLASMVFHKRLGTMQEKVERISPLAQSLAVFIPHANLTQVSRAADLCKADLVTGMVGEFPELQGVMGRYYALDQGEPNEVADAIRDHYKPAGRDDEVPQGAVAMALSLADKLDSLCGLFAAGEAPTGSKDPFALRRAALGVLRILRTHQLRIPLSLILPKASAPFKALQSSEETQVQIAAFLRDRLAVMLREEGMRHDVIDAVFADAEDDDTVRLVARVTALQAFLEGDEGAHVMAACKRASNILRKEEQKDKCTYDGDYDDDALQQTEETLLVKTLSVITPKVNDALEKEDYAEAMQHLAALRSPLDAFFEQVTVNAEAAEIRANRLQILAALRSLLRRVADFSQVEG